MVLTLYGSPMSTCTRRVGIVLMEKKIPFKFVPVDLTKGEHKKPEFVEKQPFGQVPYIVRSPPSITLAIRFNMLTRFKGRRRRLHAVREPRDLPLHRDEVSRVRRAARARRGRRAGERAV